MTGKGYHVTLLKNEENISMTLQASPPPTTSWDPMAQVLRNTWTTGFSESKKRYHRQVLCKTWIIGFTEISLKLMNPMVQVLRNTRTI